MAYRVASSYERILTAEPFEGPLGLTVAPTRGPSSGFGR
jgi:hypothetical protein